MRIFILTIITLITFLNGKQVHTPREIGDQAIYPRCFCVYEIDREYDILYLYDGTENNWEYEGVEDYCVGDYVCAIMGDNGTPDYIYDDEIIELRYGGFNYYETEVNEK